MIKSQNVYLAPLISADSAVLFQWINNPELVQFNAPYKPVTDLQHSAWFEKITQASNSCIFAIRTIDTHMLIGSCQLFNFNDIARSAELQIRIGEPDYQNKGFGTQALNLLLDFGFNNRNLNRIYLHVFANNSRAQAAYKKVGFRVEGVLRQSVFLNGEYVDIVVMGLLKADYGNMS